MASHNFSQHEAAFKQVLPLLRDFIENNIAEEDLGVFLTEHVVLRYPASQRLLDLFQRATS